MQPPSRIFAWTMALAIGRGCVTDRGANAAGRNILLLVADDLGIEGADLYPIPLRLPTTPPAAPMPNLKRLARQGILFTNAWATPGCSPTRATIFTGRAYPFRTGVGLPLPPAAGTAPCRCCHRRSSGCRGRSPPARYLLAHIGKWHLSHGTDDPNLYGWPYFAGPDPARPAAASKNYFKWPKTVNGVTSVSNCYNTTDVVDEAIGKIREAGAAKRPYFLWVAFAAATHRSRSRPALCWQARRLAHNGGKSFQPCLLRGDDRGAGH